MAMFIDRAPNRNSPPAILLRESRREGGKVLKRTIANLSSCPEEAIEAFALALRGVRLLPQGEAFAIESSLPHGHVQLVLGAMNKLGMAELLCARPCPEQRLVLAMIAQRLLTPCSKLATVRRWKTTSLARTLEVAEADENGLYVALDWLLERQTRIEKKLAKRHLNEGARVLFDVSSSSYHGRTCPLAARGYNRDGDKLPAIVYGLLADAQGRPVGVDVYAGNTADPATVPDQVDKLRERFGLDRVVLVGDRGMLTQAQIDAIKTHPGLGWISALRARSIQKLAARGEVQMGLFDTCNLAEIRSDLFPGERLAVCYNPLLAQDRKRTREELLAATERLLQGIADGAARRTKKPLTQKEIALKAGKRLNHYKVGKHFKLEIADGSFSFSRRHDKIAAEAALDGIYIVRTSEPTAALSAEDAVRAYKSLQQVEQAFRCLKGLDLRIRPIHHRTEDHVRAHIFLCMLAYYVEWRLRRDLAHVLFQDEELDDARWTRDPVAKAEASQSARDKKKTKTTQDGWPVHSWQTLLADMATRTQNQCRAGEGKNTIRFELLAEPTPFQKHVFGLAGVQP
jgi:transposase